MNFVNLNKFSDYRGSLTYIEDNYPFPLLIGKVSWINNFNDECELNLNEISFFHNENENLLIVSLFGEIKISDQENKSFFLNQPSEGILLYPVERKYMLHIKKNSVLLFLTLVKNFNNHPKQNNNLNNDFNLIELKKHKLKGGSDIITLVKNDDQMPFVIRRLFYIYQIPENASRGEHAHKTCDQFILALNGSFNVSIFNGKEQMIVELNNNNGGIYLPHGIWYNAFNFSYDAVCLAFASEVFNSEDYINDIQDYMEIKKCLKL